MVTVEEGGEGIWPPGGKGPRLGFTAGEGGTYIGERNPLISSSCKRSTTSLHLKSELCDLVEVLGMSPTHIYVHTP